jgi:predicted TIM-barrel fold metal-dependent hydrolase
MFGISACAIKAGSRMVRRSAATLPSPTFRPRFTEMVQDELQGRLFGSDWPVSIQGASYQQVYEVAELICCDLSQDERANFLGGTARRLYGLNQPQ